MKVTTVQKLAKSCKKYKGITFMDNDGNIINGDNNLEQEKSEITGVDEHKQNDVHDTQQEKYRNQRSGRTTK